MKYPQKTEIKVPQKIEQGFQWKILKKQGKLKWKFSKKKHLKLPNAFVQNENTCSTPNVQFIVSLFLSQIAEGNSFVTSYPRYLIL